MNLALFDLDGTITRKDTFIEFLKSSVPPLTIASGALKLMLPTWQYFRKKIANHRYKEQVLTHFYGGWEVEKFTGSAEEYSRKRLQQIVKQSALDRLAWHGERGDRIVVVSASIRFWLEAWCREHGAELICTELVVQDGKITGKLDGPNCYGPEKVKRINAFLSLSDYETIYAYGDSRGDREMLALADKPHYRFFD